MMFALSCDVNPLVQYDSRDGHGHQVVALLAIATEGLRSQHLPEAVAVDVDERLDVAMVAFHPTKRTGHLYLVRE